MASHRKFNDWIPTILRTIICGSFLLATTGMQFCVARAALAETLQEAVQAALDSHPSVESALAAKAVAKQDRREQFSGLFPEVNASFTGGRIFGDNSTSRGLQTTRGEAYSWLWEGSASVTQPIFDGLEVFNRLDAAKARYNKTRYEVVDAKENLALSAVQAYLRVLQSQQALAQAVEYQNTLKNYMNLIQEMLDQGAADTAEMKQAENVVKLLENRIAEFDGEKESALASYLEVVGRLPEGGLARPVIAQDTVHESVDGAVESAQTHPLLLAARNELEATSHDIDAEKGTLYPDLNGELSYLKKDQIETLGGELLDKRAVVRLNWNFSTGGAQIARIRRTKALYSESLARLQETRRQVERDVRESYAQVQKTKRQLDLVREREEILEDLFETYQSQFEGLRVRLLQLMQAENQLFGTRLEKLTSEYTHLAAQYALLAGTGRLTKILGVDTKRNSLEEVSYDPGEDVFDLPVIEPKRAGRYKTLRGMKRKNFGAQKQKVRSEIPVKPQAERRPISHSKSSAAAPASENTEERTDVKIVEPIRSVNPVVVKGEPLSFKLEQARSEKLQQDIEALEKEIQQLDEGNAALEKEVSDKETFSTKKTITHNAPFRYTLAIEEYEDSAEQGKDQQEPRFLRSEPPKILWSISDAIKESE